MSTFYTLREIIKIPATANQNSQLKRLFHGRGQAYEGLEHVVIDWLPPVVLIILYTPEPTAEIVQLAQWLMASLPGCRSVQLQHRYQFTGPVEVLLGENIQRFTVTENNLQFHISLGRSQNIGLFLDMRNGRQWVQQHSKDKRVLNLFAYTCAFSVSAIAGGARSVLNVDMSRAAMNTGRENHRLNRQSLERVRFEKLNIFNSFGRLKRRGPFDLLICDPPTFQKGSVEIVKDYPKMMRRLDDFMTDNAVLLLCLNSPELPVDYLVEQMKINAPAYLFVATIKPPEEIVEQENKGVKAMVFKKFI